VTLASDGTGATAAAGTHSITPSSAAGSGLSNYTISYSAGVLTVAQKALLITPNNRRKTYGETFTVGTTDFRTSGLVNGDSVTSVTMSSTLGGPATAAIGTYPITATAQTGSGLSNYSISYAPGELVVDKKALKVTAKPQSKTYGETFAFTGEASSLYDLDGLVNDDTVTSVTLASTGTGAAAAAGQYSIVASAATGASCRTTMSAT